MSDDAITKFKQAQREGWAYFTPLEAVTTPSAALLVKFARVRAGQHVLDVGCGTGVAAITAARLGANVCGIDLTPELLTRAEENARIAEVQVDWREGDAEQLPHEDAAFDVVLSQFGHMFAPRPQVATREMLRVLKPGGTIAFATWPPTLCIGRTFTLVASYMPPAPPGVSPPPEWGDANIVRQRLHEKVTNITFHIERMLVPALSPQHYRTQIEMFAGPMRKLVETFSGSDPARLAHFRREYDAIIRDYIEGNVVKQDYLLTRATKI
ncbi:MAG TPA: class I SAM-dependent methyltransferase [Chthoniobacterales bacterium]|nr:class I SAM-dependent methyltransferase [Chthoniobacterales bacterium]